MQTLSSLSKYTDRPEPWLLHVLYDAFLLLQFLYCILNTVCISIYIDISNIKTSVIDGNIGFRIGLKLKIKCL